MVINSGYSLAGNKMTSTMGLTTINRCIHMISRFIIYNNLNTKLDDFIFYEYSIKTTHWGNIINGIAFINTKNGKFLYSMGSQAKYSCTLS
ncbi:hypothetical protein BTW00_01515 [Psychrobacter sp. C 20.9]|nr:hypothetical protein BTW00_01515 [Psychrobacter sp. C 20.9]